MSSLQKYFAYDNGPAEITNSFRISASQVSRFFDSTSQWYREFLLGESGFEGSTASELGNLVHAAAAMYADTGSVDYSLLEAYINSITNPEVDKSILRDQYLPMVSALLSQFLSKTIITASEKFVYHRFTPSVVAGGSIDALSGSTIIDYKTTSSKTPPKSFPRAYWFQLMTYAWVLHQQHIPVDFLKLVYITRNETGRISEKTGKPLKDYPSQVFTLVEPVTQENLDLIGNCLQLISDSVAFWQKHPEHRYLLAQDYRLKQPEAPILFKD